MFSFKNGQEFSTIRELKKLVNNVPDEKKIVIEGVDDLLYHCDLAKNYKKFFNNKSLEDCRFYFMGDITKCMFFVEDEEEKEINPAPVNKVKIINLFGIPGAGKSTGAANIFSKLKMAGINAELITEFAKDKVWEESKAVFKNQAYIFGKQSFRISRCADKVDVIVTDSPLPLSIFYNDDPKLTENFNLAIMDFFNSYDNKNYLVTRVKPYNPVGRHQSEEESNALAEPIVDLLEERNIPYKTIPGCEEGYDVIVKEILEEIKAEKGE